MFHTWLSSRKIRYNNELQLRLLFVYIYEAAFIPHSLILQAQNLTGQTFFHSTKFEDSENVNPLT